MSAAQVAEQGARDSITLWRKETRVSQDTLAAYVTSLGYPLDGSMISRIENGKRGLGFGEYIALRVAMLALTPTTTTEVS